MAPSNSGRLGCLLLAVLASGCGGKYDTHAVQGKVTLTDGTPLENVQVTFKCQQPPITATAITEADGNYSLGTVAPGDGAPAGQYRVSVVELSDYEDPDNPKPPRIDRRYGHFKRSGLEFTVPAEDNNYDIRLDPAKGRP